MNKLNERLTLIANVSVVVGIIFLAVELQQNTQAIQAQTRDADQREADGTLRVVSEQSRSGVSISAGSVWGGE